MATTNKRSGTLFIPRKTSKTFNPATYNTDMLAIQNWANALFGSWRALTLTSGWANATSSFPAQYRKVADIVFLRHLVAGSGAVIGILPPGYRPTHFVVLPARGTGGFAAVRVATNGHVTLTVGSGSVYLTSVQFSIL